MRIELLMFFSKQETQHTDVLAKAGAEEALRQRFSSLKQVNQDMSVGLTSSLMFCSLMKTRVFAVNHSLS